MSEYDFQIKHIKGKKNKVVDALSRNARLNFAATISTYASNLNEQLNEGVKQDENYQKLQITATEKPTESLIKVESGLNYLKINCMCLMCLRLSC